jgi:hypothetical protein
VDPGFEAGNGLRSRRPGEVRFREHVHCDVRPGPDGQEHPLAVRRENDVARVAMSPRYSVDDLLRFPGGLQVTVSVTEAALDRLSATNRSPLGAT